MNKQILLFTLLFISINLQAQIKILFDATKAETASNADWIIDADEFNLGYDPNPYIGGNEANPQRFPTPDQSTVTENTYENYWTGANSAWGIESVQYGYQVETLPYNGQITFGNSYNEQDLSNYDVFIVTEPNISFTNEEKTAILEFVYNGGGLFITADHDISDRNGDGVDSVDIWNDLFRNNDVAIDPFGFLFDYENFSETTYNIADIENDPILQGVFGNVYALEFHGGTTMSLFPSDNTSITPMFFRTGADNSGTNDVLFAHATFGEGRVVAMGDSSPADDGTGDSGDNLYNGWYEEANGDHRKMIMNATVWLAEGGTNSIETDLLNNNIRLYVNNGQLNIYAPELNLKEAQLYNSLGQCLNNYMLDQTQTIPVSNYKKGMYFILLTDKKGFIYHSKFIIE